MATFKRTGTIGTFRIKMIEGMVARTIARDFAERCFSQIEGFGEYGFPESHAASFALLVYASAWLKCRYPDVFAAALLNAQPMGFYAPAQIVRDLREHGVEVRPVDINHSDWDATLEPGSHAIERMQALHREMAGDIRTTHALRLGFRKIKGLSDRDATLIVTQRNVPYSSVRDLWLRTGLSPRIIERLADADTFGSLGLTRRQALWAAKALGRVGGKDDDLPLFQGRCDAVARGRRRAPGTCVSFSSARARRAVAAHAAGRRGRERLSLPRIVAARAPGVLPARRPRPARHHPQRGTAAYARRARVSRVSGLVTIRQRPGSANGVIFMTIEDETAIANIIVWPKTFERFRPIILGARYVAVSWRSAAGIQRHPCGCGASSTISLACLRV